MLYPQRRRRSGELNGDHTVTQLATSWIQESWEEAGTRLENVRGRWSEIEESFLQRIFAWKESDCRLKSDS